jgi:hypothetical protein
MTIKEIQAKTESMTNYLGYLLLVFCWFFLDNRFTAVKTDLPSSWWLTLTEWGITLVIGPLLLAGTFGGIYAKQRSSGSEENRTGFFQAVKTHFLRFLGANFLSLAIYLIVLISVMAARGVDP